MTSLFLARHRLLFVLLGGFGIATALAMDLPANQIQGAGGTRSVCSSVADCGWSIGQHDFTTFP
jgi:hypothetical protein